MSYLKRTLGMLVALAGVAALPLVAADVGRFSLSVGSHDNLVISGSGGQSVADLPAPTVGENITVDSTALQVSYGRDANGQLTAILAGPSQNSVSLHFSAGGKSIDADKAVVTVTFSPDLKGVLVDPGYVGTVEVDSHVLRARSLADDLPVPASGPSDAVVPNLPPSLQANNATPAPAAAPQASSTAPEVALTPVTPPVASVAEATPAPATDSATLAANATQPGATPAPSSSSSAPNAVVPLASQLTPMLAPTATASPSTTPAPSPYQSVQQRVVSTMQPIAPSGATTIQKLYWSEPITSPDGSTPQVASNEIRLVEVRGMVTVVSPGGQEQTGTEGMLVPSGATVRTAGNSSAALFMGGVNSARMMPGCELIVTQTLTGPLRTNVIDLKSGAVFSRIGHRDGETENYSVSTPEGVTGAESNDMMAFRGTPDDVRSSGLTKLDLDTKTLLAWDPAPTHGLISDVPGWDLASVDSKDKNDDKGGDQKGNQKDDQKGNPNTYFYYCQSGGQVQSDNVRHEVFCQDDHGSNDGRGGNDGGNNFGGGDDHRGGKKGSHDHQECKPQQVLQQILETLQPYNCKLKQVLTDIDSGKATEAEQKFYHKLITVFFCVQEPGIVNQFENDRKKFDKNIDIYNKVLCQDLKEFKLDCLTPH